MQSKCKLFAKVLIFSDIPNFFCKKNSLCKHFLSYIAYEATEYVVDKFRQVTTQALRQSLFLYNPPCYAPLLEVVARCNHAKTPRAATRSVCTLCTISTKKSAEVSATP